MVFEVEGGGADGDEEEAAAGDGGEESGGDEGFVEPVGGCGEGGEEGEAEGEGDEGGFEADPGVGFVDGAAPFDGVGVGESVEDDGVREVGVDDVEVGQADELGDDEGSGEGPDEGAGVDEEGVGGVALGFVGVGGGEGEECEGEQEYCPTAGGDFVGEVGVLGGDGESAEGGDEEVELESVGVDGDALRGEAPGDDDGGGEECEG